MTVPTWRASTAVVLVGFVMAMTAPIELVYALRLGLDTAAVTSFILVSAVGVVAVDVLGTRAIPRLDARTTLVAGLVLFATSEALFAISDSAAALLPSRALQGAGGAAVSSAVLQLALRTHARPQHGLGSNQGLLLFGGVVGAPTGGLMAGMLPGIDGFRIAFWLCGGLTVVTAVTVWLLLPPLPAPAGGRRPRIGLPDLRVPVVARLAIALGMFGTFLRNGIEGTAFPLVGEAGGVSPATIGLALGLITAVEIVVLTSSGRLFDRVAPVVCLGTALVIGAGAAVVLAFASGLPGFFTAAALFGIVGGVALAAPPVLVVRLSPDAGTGLATYRIACGVGSLLGGSSVNLLIASLGATGGLGAVAGILFGGVLLVRATGQRIAAAVPVVRPLESGH